MAPLPAEMLIILVSISSITLFQMQKQEFTCHLHSALYFAIEQWQLLQRKKTVRILYGTLKVEDNVHTAADWLFGR